MGKTPKISISLSAEDLRFLKQRAKQTGASVSGVVAEATRLLRQREARERVLRRFGKDALVAPRVAERIRAEWQG